MTKTVTTTKDLNDATKLKLESLVQLLARQAAQQDFQDHKLKQNIN
ncbi:hypothetical protein [Curvivirga sp.]